MANHWTPLKAVDQSLVAYFVAQGITGLNKNNVLRLKETGDKTELPILICAATNATRRRHKNWEVDGSIVLKSNLSTDPNEADTQLATSDELETDIFDALETNTPDNDRPQVLAAAIQSAAVAAAVVDSDKFLIVNFMLKSCSQGVDADGNWEWQIDFLATVAQATN